MAKGGARNRNGSFPDPNSVRSAASGFEYTKLPAEGFSGEVPDFPLGGASERELEVWARLWKTPQAAAWAVDEWRWMTVAMYTRLFARVEDPEATAGLTAQLHRFADQIGMTTAGLAEMGWKISRDGTEVSGVAKPKVKREPTLREQASAAAGWQVINGERAG